MKTLKTSGAAVRNSFINEFAFGDKTQAIQDLVKRVHESGRFDGISSDEFIYRDIVRDQRAYARSMRISQARVSA